MTVVFRSPLRLYALAMAYSSTASMFFPHPPEQLHHASYDALLTLCNPSSVYPNGATVTGRTKLSWWTFGDDVIVQIGVDERGSCATVTSKSMLPTQIVDYGRHRKNVEKVFYALQRRLGPGQPAEELPAAPAPLA